ncbi:hypothetical protein R3P38DRAFT_2542017 [Favolaschia claudopus]|uniref:Reverse transcriptase zinc-binding domain-containing protein n=1 Tax=Favolaschia claudopus TaxID=2862362 RepID=A0AAW0AU09_9AGAR
MSSWYGDLAIVLRDLPFSVPALPPLRELNAVTCKALQDQVTMAMKNWVWDSIQQMVSVPLLHGRLEPRKDGPSQRIPLCQRHYLSAVTVADHRLALTRLLCGSYHFRGLHTNLADHLPFDLVCRKCGVERETPGHVFMRCLDPQTVAARQLLHDALYQQFRVLLLYPLSLANATLLMQQLIFDCATVVPMARFIYRVIRAWHWFGRRLPTMVSEGAPDSDDSLGDGFGPGFRSGTEDASDLDVDGIDMWIDM